MNQFNLGNFLNKFINYPSLNSNGGAGRSPAPNSGINSALSKEALNSGLMQKSLTQANTLSRFNFSTLADLKMNSLASLESSIYLKDLMNLPKELKEVLTLIQSNGVSTEELAKLLNTNISITTIAEMLQKNGKEAMNKLIFAMSEASKQGITDLSQLKDTIKLINASISVLSADNPNQTLKCFMLLYLPWLPLQEGVDFELEIETSSGENGEDETILTIMITTRNYGNIKIVVMLKGLNSFDIFVNCVEDFPKEELLKRIQEESKRHSLQSELSFEQKEKKSETEHPREAKISMSNLSEVNPFLLLIANALIRHTIELDNLAG